MQKEGEIFQKQQKELNPAQLLWTRCTLKATQTNGAMKIVTHTSLITSIMYE